MPDEEWVASLYKWIESNYDASVFDEGDYEKFI